MARLSTSCLFCHKEVAIKISTDLLIVHDTPDGVECEGSETSPYSLPKPDISPAAKQRRKDKKKRKSTGNGGSVWTVSGGLPGLGKRSR